MQTDKLIEEIINRGWITEKEILLLKRRLNNKKDIDVSRLEDFDIGVSYEQTDKGYKWLMDQWKTPKGKIRKNNPFGYREQDALKSFKYFIFKGFYDAGSFHFSHYEPLYCVVGEEGSFTYYVFGGETIIIL
jgi:hypothetical protein